jgi:hypothetical protein
LESLSDFDENSDIQSFINENEDLVKISLEDDFLDVQPLCNSTTLSVRRLISNETNIIKIGEEIYHFTENFQFVYDIKDFDIISNLINQNKIENIEEMGVKKYFYDDFYEVESRNIMECEAEQDDGWRCRRVKVRGEYCTQFLFLGDAIWPEWIFTTRSFVKTLYIWFPVDANNRVSADFIGRVITDANAWEFNFSIPLTVQQDDTFVEVVATTDESIPINPFTAFVMMEADGTSFHNLTRFAHNCEYDIDCGLAF